MIKLAIAVVIAIATLLIVVSTKKKKTKRTSTAPSLIPATEGFEGDGLPEYKDVEYFADFNEES